MSAAYLVAMAVVLSATSQGTAMAVLGWLLTGRRPEPGSHAVPPTPRQRLTHGDLTLTS